MAGWAPQKRAIVERNFYRFLNRCYINSKDSGRICLGDHLYSGQQRLITDIFDALEDDIHNIYVLKSRQLGISTIIRALIIFLAGVQPGLKGAIVFDTEGNKLETRHEIEVMIEDLPHSLGFPEITQSNRQGTTFDNSSKLLWMSAGTRKSKSSGTLGRSVGVSLAHCSELCSWDNDEGLEAFTNSLSDANPDRLYIYESTARGFNRWYTLWGEARKDPDHCRCIFLGWWSKDNQQIEQSDRDFERYGTQPPTEKERKRIADVKKRYGIDITPEMLAWVRRKMDPSAEPDGDAPAEYEGSVTRLQEQPWTEEDAFQMTGTVFFAPEKLAELTNKWVTQKCKTYMFMAGTEFFDMRVFKAANQKSIELKVWEEPEVGGSYVMAIDPAFGSNEKNDRSAIQVLKCYSDGLDQVAEYAFPLIGTLQLAWVIAALLGWYGAGNNEIRYILELNGPGTAVFNELRSLKAKLDARYQFPQFSEKGLIDVFRNVKTYIYTRADSMGAGYNYHFLTNTRIKIQVMERLRDFVTNESLRVRSLETVREMGTIARDGDSIEAPGSMHDDRVYALAMAVHCWEEKIRRNLMLQKRSRQNEADKKSMSLVNQVQLFNQNHLDTFFKSKKAERTNDLRALQRQNWRYGHRRW